MPHLIPKFGSRVDTILLGMANMITILTTKYEEPLIYWLQQLMESALDSFRQALSSTYLQNKLVEAKIDCFYKFTARLYKYGSEKLQVCVR